MRMAQTWPTLSISSEIQKYKRPAVRRDTRKAIGGRAGLRAVTRDSQTLTRLVMCAKYSGLET
jgi:hypothetical protein